jgi:ATP-dependent RNA helicase DDX41
MAPDVSTPKRRRIEPEEKPALSLDDADDYVPYIPVAQRRQQRFEQLANRGYSRSSALTTVKHAEEQEAKEDEEREEELRREKARKERTLLEEAQDVHRNKAEEGI